MKSNEERLNAMVISDFIVVKDRQASASLPHTCVIGFLVESESLLSFSFGRLAPSCCVAAGAR
jgi:hypothetical protein